MSIIEITTDKYLIFTEGSNINYNHNTIGQCTSYNDEFWTKEEFTVEQDWLDRLLVYGITQSGI